MSNRFHRHPRTTQERRAWHPDLSRPARAPHRLPTTWWDLLRQDQEDRSWKRYRRAQYKGVDVGDMERSDG